MKKDKLNFIVYKYSIDICFFTYLILSICLCTITILGLFESIYFLIPLIALVLFDAFMIFKILYTKKKVSANETESILINNAKAFIKETKETSRCGAILIKLYIIDDDKNKYNYYYLTGSENKFKEYRDIINSGSLVKILLFKGTKIISTIFVDNEELKDLYCEIKYSKKIRKPIIYNHIKYNSTKKGIYEYEEYDILDVKLVFEKSSLYEELYIINSNKKYVKISYNQENHKEFLIDKKVYGTFDELQKELEVNSFVFDGKIRVIYTANNTEPTSFNMLINQVK
ncbi:MAG: hypothetical protein J6B79_00975 [Clostridia bacterium]|nr:hypothetical protein [Clostridia bacterium]